MYSAKVFSASTALRYSYPTRRNMEVRRETEEQVPFGLFANISFYDILHPEYAHLWNPEARADLFPLKERYTVAYLQNRRDPH